MMGHSVDRVDTERAVDRLAFFHGEPWWSGS
jgi:hypothetical protein